MISPLLSNIYLDEFDQEMKAHGIRIVRYADDILVFARSPRQAQRYLDLAVEILEKEMHLKVNREKTHLTQVEKGVAFLGFVIYPEYVTIQPKRVKRFKQKVRELTPRNHGMNVEAMVKRLNRTLRGWINYFRIANCKGCIKALMSWIRRRLRMKQMREWKRWKPLHRALRQQGHTGSFKKISMRTWRNSSCTLVHMALPNSWFEKIGLLDMASYKVGVLSHYYE